MPPKQFADELILGAGFAVEVVGDEPRRVSRQKVPRAAAAVVHAGGPFAADVLYQAAVAAGAPPDIIQCVGTATMEGTNALMKHPRTGVILATGGSAMVRAAYSSGKPAFGVGPGNVPVLLDDQQGLNGHALLEFGGVHEEDPAAVGAIAGPSVDRSRLCEAAALVPWLPKGAPLLVALALSAAGALGVFPLYHAFTQDLPERHQGKITGIAGVAAWLVPAQAQRLFGMLADRTGSFDTGIAVATLLPAAACLLLVAFWPRATAERPVV